MLTVQQRLQNKYISELDKIAMGTFQMMLKMKKNLQNNNNKKNFSNLWDSIEFSDTCVIQVAKGKENVKTEKNAWSSGYKVLKFNDKINIHIPEDVEI